MIEEIIKDVTALYETLRVPGKALEDFQSIVGGDTKVITDLQPALQFEWNGLAELTRHGNGYRLDLGFWQSAISSSLEGRAKGRAEHSHLVTKFAEGKVRGMIAASLYLEGLRLQTSEIAWNISVEPKTNPMEVHGGHQDWTFVTTQTVTFTTLLNRCQLRP